MKMLLVFEMEGFLFYQKGPSQIKGKRTIESSVIIREDEFKWGAKLYKSRPNALKFLDLCLSKFDVGILSSKYGMKDGTALFRKFLSDRKVELEPQLLFLWFLERCTKDKRGKTHINMDKVWEEFTMKSSESNTTMFVLEGDNVQVHPSDNCILEKPYNTSSDEEESDMIRGIWKVLSKIQLTTELDRKTFILSLNSIHREFNIIKCIKPMNILN